MNFRTLCLYFRISDCLLLELELVFKFVELHTIIDWFKISPFEPDGRDDAVFAIMKAHDPDELKTLAVPICNYWGKPDVQKHLSKDLPPFQ